MIDFEEFKSKSQWQQMSIREKILFTEEIELHGTEEEKAALAYDWINIWSRPEQIPYMYTNISDWDTWYYIAGRGSGKTKAGAELIRQLVFYIFPNFPLRMGCVTPKFSDIESVVALGDSGVMNVLAPWEKDKARFYSTSRKIDFNEETPYESYIEFCSADNPESLRGHQYHIMWLDELAAYPDPSEILMQVAMCLRLKLPNGDRKSTRLNSSH